MALVWRTFSEAVRQAAHAEYVASFEPCRDGDGYAIPSTFVVVSGVRPGA